MNAFLIDAFSGYGVPREDAEICADVLLESDRRGIEIQIRIQAENEPFSVSGKVVLYLCQ